MSTVSSRDGTTIGYDKVGEGPALILVDGALSVHSSGGKSELAKLLAPRLAVYGYDRRGYDHAAIIGEPWSPPTDVAKQVPVPALVMAGDASLPFMPDTAQALAQALPYGQLQVLADQTHNVDPRVLAPVLADFFSS